MISKFFLKQLFIGIFLCGSFNICGMEDKKRLNVLSDITQQMAQDVSQFLVAERVEHLLRLWVTEFEKNSSPESTQHLCYLDSILYVLNIAHFKYDVSLLTDILFYACLYGHEPLVKRLIELGADLNKYVLKGDSPMMSLQVACNADQLEIMKILLAAKKIMFLHQRAINGDPLLWELVCSIIDKVHDPEAGITYDVYKDIFRQKMILILSHAHQDINCKSGRDGNSLLHVICQDYLRREEIGEIIALLLHYGADPNMKNNEGLTPFHVFLREHGNNTLLREDEDTDSFCNNIATFLQYNADVHTVDTEGNGLLHTLMHQCPGKTFQHLFRGMGSLLDNGVNPELKNSKGKTPLHLFIKNYSKINYEEKSLWYPADVINKLWFSGADVCEKDNKGNAPLHYAAKQICISSVPMLRFHGAQPEAKNNERKRAIDVISEKLRDIEHTEDTEQLIHSFSKEFVYTKLARYCTQGCAFYSRKSAVQQIGNPLKYLKNREIGFKGKR